MASQSLSTNGNLPSAAVTITLPSVSDISGIYATSCNVSTQKFPVGITYIGCTTQDTSKLVSTCAFYTNVIDQSYPALNCPAAVSSYTSGGAPSSAVVFMVTSSDASGITYRTCNASSGDTFNYGITPVLCSATDGVGKITTCLFNVTVNDQAVPVLVCPSSSMTVTTNGNAPSSNVTLPVTASDASGIKSLACSPASNSLFPPIDPLSTGSSTYYTNVNCTAIDGVNKTTTCTFRVYV